MQNTLEYPNSPGVAEWDALYRARGDAVQEYRPVFTGDVYLKLDLPGESKARSVLILQHPCALRSDGLNLHGRLLAAKITGHPLIPADEWLGHASKMPLPELVPEAGNSRRFQAAFFDDLYLVPVESLEPQKRVACLSQTGVNLVLQRWVHHNSRVVVPSWLFQEVSSGPFEEADLTEYWCEERVDSVDSLAAATAEALAWLREDVGDTTRQSRLEDPQQRSAVRQEMRLRLRKLNQSRSAGA